MLVGGVAQHLVHDDFEAEGVGAFDQRVEVFQRAEQAVDFLIVRDVVAHICLRGLGDRRQPDGVHSERCDVIEAPQYTGQVADPIAIGVLKGPGIDLIDHPAAPPFPHRKTSPICRR
jgi:hypothetical protein